MNLCLSAYRFKQPMISIYRATLPFYLILLAGVLLITYVPELTAWPVKWLGWKETLLARISRLGASMAEGPAAKTQEATHFVSVLDAPEAIT
jgi:hypothetical protein